MLKFIEVNLNFVSIQFVLCVSTNLSKRHGSLGLFGHLLYHVYQKVKSFHDAKTVEVYRGSKQDLKV